MNKILNKRRIILFMGILVLLSILLFVLSFFMGIKQKQYENELYKVQYDSTWKISKKDDMSLSLIHKKSKSNIDITMVELSEELASKEIEDLVDSIKLDIQSKNPNYSLITEHKAEITNREYRGYEMLFEDSSSQAMVRLGKIDDKLFSITYVAANECFDILLDSVDNVVDNFEVKIEKYDLKTEPLKIDTTGINYSKQDDYTIQEEVNEYEINNYKFNVKYSIPKDFDITDWDTTSGNFRLNEGLEIGQSIRVYAEVRKDNIYEFITDEKCYGGIASEKKSWNEKVEKEPDKYTNMKWESEKLDNDLCEAYIYKQSYDYNYTGLGSNQESSKREKIYMIYSLDYLRTFVISISSEGTSIDEKMIQTIKLNSFEKYGEDIDKNIENGELTGMMKSFCDYSKDKYYEIKYSIPTDYIEIDVDNNKYARKYFYGGEYNESLHRYEYTIHLDLSHLSSKYYMEDKEKECNNEYNVDGSVKFLKSVTDNEFEFKVYSQEYTRKEGGSKYHVLFAIADLSEGGRYIVEVTADAGKKIPVEVIDDFISGNTLEVKSIKVGQKKSIFE